MLQIRRVAATTLLLFGLAGAARCEEPPVPTALQDYVAIKDDAYKLEVGETTKTPKGSVTACVLTSQSWSISL